MRIQAREGDTFHWQAIRREEPSAGSGLRASSAELVAGAEKDGLGWRRGEGRTIRAPMAIVTASLCCAL